MCTCTHVNSGVGYFTFNILTSGSQSFKGCYGIDNNSTKTKVIPPCY